MAAAVVLPVAHANPRSVGNIGGVLAVAGNLVPRASGPHPVYIARRQGPTTMYWLNAPDQGASQGANRPVGTGWEEINSNILPLDLNFTFNFVPFTIACFTIDQYIEHVSSSRLYCR